MIKFHDAYQVVTETGCWLWTAATSRGYGQISVGGKVKYAHRHSYEIHTGPIGDGLCVCHKCDTPQCVNPNHLFLGSTSDNIKDMHRKMRSSIKKMSDTQLLDAISLRNSGWTYKQVADRYGVSAQAVYERIRQQQRANP